MSNDFDGLGDKVFYGFLLDPSNGNLQIDILDGDQPVKLPQEDIIDPLDYSQYFWSSDSIRFEFDAKGHLLMRIL